MRLSDFITANLEPILQDWDDFARTIETPGAPLDTEALRDHAEQMLDAYIVRSGGPRSHFAAVARVDYPQGWEFSWIYAPCPDVARLRVFIRRSGSGHYGEFPDCHPLRGLGAAPQRV